MGKILTSDNIQTIAFFALVIVFALLEKFRPAREINRWKDLKIDILSFAIGVSLSRLCYSVIFNFCQTHLAPDALYIWQRLATFPIWTRIGMALVATDF